MNPVDGVQLRTGSSVSASALTTTMMVLTDLYDGVFGLDGAAAIADLVAVARDPEYDWAGAAGSRQLLMDLKIIAASGVLTTETRDIVLAAFEGEEGRTHMVEPLGERS